MDEGGRGSREGDPRNSPSEDVLRQAFWEAPIGIVVTDVGPSPVRIVAANEAFCRLTGYAVGDLTGQPLTSLIDFDGHEDDESSILDLLMAGRVEAALSEHRIQTADHSERWVRVHGATATSEGTPAHGVWLVEDITDRKAVTDRLVWQAFHDPLTGLANRQVLMDRLQVALSRLARHSHHVAVLYLDVDHFKQVNDQYGHAAGDLVLAEIARRVETVLRPGDTVGRLGGDEFLVVCNEVADRAAALNVAERIAQVCSAPFPFEGDEIELTLSLGVTLRSSPSEEAEAVLRAADMAMYEAKNQGRARFELYDESLEAYAADRVDRVRILRTALRDGNFELHYQPIIDLRSGQMAGVEALLRLRHPTQGLLRPESFMALAAEQGQTNAIGAWVIEEACRQQAAWNEMSRDPPVVSVNVAAGQIRQPGIDELVRDIIGRTHADPSRLILEMNETAFMDAVDSLNANLRALKAAGVRLALDDFGTGYSSLTYLKRFPIDVLKIDQSFVSGLGADADDLAIVTAIIDLAHSMGLRTVGEGIEQADQLIALQRLGCDEGQGYLMSHPMPAGSISALLPT